MCVCMCMCMYVCMCMCVCVICAHYKIWEKKWKKYFKIKNTTVLQSKKKLANSKEKKQIMWKEKNQKNGEGIISKQSK